MFGWINLGIYFCIIVFYNNFIYNRFQFEKNILKYVI